MFLIFMMGYNESCRHFIETIRNNCLFQCFPLRINRQKLRYMWNVYCILTISVEKNDTNLSNH